MNNLDRYLFRGISIETGGVTVEKENSSQMIWNSIETVPLKTAIVLAECIKGEWTFKRRFFITVPPLSKFKGALWTYAPN